MIRINDMTRLYPFSVLKKPGTPLVDAIAGRKISITFDSRDQTASVQGSDGESLPHFIAFLADARAFYPTRQQSCCSSVLRTGDPSAKRSSCHAFLHAACLRVEHCIESSMRQRARYLLRATGEFRRVFETRYGDDLQRFGHCRVDVQEIDKVAHFCPEPQSHCCFVDNLARIEADNRYA